jgi:hypothetical protein
MNSDQEAILLRHSLASISLALVQVQQKAVMGTLTEMRSMPMTLVRYLEPRKTDLRSSMWYLARYPHPGLAPFIYRWLAHMIGDELDLTIAQEFVERQTLREVRLYLIHVIRCADSRVHSASQKASQRTKLGAYFSRLLTRSSTCQVWVLSVGIPESFLRTDCPPASQRYQTNEHFYRYDSNYPHHHTVLILYARW